MMPIASEEEIACPFCAEQIDRDATRCHWCRNEVAGLTPTHGGRCPACLQEIKAAALVCRHCGESFVPIQAIIGRSLSASQQPCGCSGHAEQRPCVGCGGGTPGIYGKSVQPVVASSAAQPGGHTVSIPLAQLLNERSLSRTTNMTADDQKGGGGGGGGSTCHWSIKLVPCTLCFPFTNYCWEDTCLEIGLDCSGSF
jgi:hypothetical protein